MPPCKVSWMVIPYSRVWFPIHLHVKLHTKRKLDSFICTTGIKSLAQFILCFAWKVVQYLFGVTYLWTVIYCKIHMVFERRFFTYNIRESNTTYSSIYFMDDPKRKTIMCLQKQIFWKIKDIHFSMANNIICVSRSLYR